MDKKEVVAKVVQTIIEVQKASGRSSAGIGDSTCPVGGVEGFDSLNGVEATVMLSKSLGAAIPDDYNPFISSDGNRALSVSEIADSLSTYVGTGAFVG